MSHYATPLLPPEFDTISMPPIADDIDAAEFNY